MTPTKYIREGRMGPAMSYKTGAVLTTYPRPLLVFNLDRNGLEVIQEPVEVVDSIGLCKLCTAEKLPPLTAVNIANPNTIKLGNEYLPTKTRDPFNAFINLINTVIINGCPWKTVVLDNLSSLTDIIVSDISESQPKSMEDARNWASKTGQKIMQVIGVFQGFKAHTVVIMHSTVDKVELTGDIREVPMVPSQWLRDRIPSVFTQFFYATVDGGKAYVLVKPFGLIKGIGARWPNFTETKIGATFKDIYGKEPGLV